MSVADTVEAVVHRYSRRLNVVSGVALVAMMGLVVVNVIARAVWDPILGTYEFVGFLASVTISFAVAHCAARKGHVAITVFTDGLPLRVQALLDAAVGVLGAGLYLVLTWQCCRYALVIYRSGEVSLTTETPFYPFIFGVAFGFGMLAVVLGVDAVKSFRKAFAR